MENSTNRKIFRRFRLAFRYIYPSRNQIPSLGSRAAPTCVLTPRTAKRDRRKSNQWRMPAGLIMPSISALALPCFFGIYLLRLLAHFAKDITAYSEIRYMRVIRTCGDCYNGYSVAAIAINNFPTCYNLAKMFSLQLRKLFITSFCFHHNAHINSTVM